MPGLGIPDCKLFQTSWEIRDQWPGLRYLPRPEPPVKCKDHEYWLHEYVHWKRLRCGTGNGYFCRRHGRWITCLEIRSGVPEQRREPHDHCPDRHKELQQMIDGFFYDEMAEHEKTYSGAAALPDDLKAHDEGDTGVDAEGLASGMEGLQLQATSGAEETETGYPSAAQYQQQYDSYSQTFSDYSAQSYVTSTPSWGGMQAQDAAASRDPGYDEDSGAGHKPSKRSSVPRDRQASKGSKPTDDTRQARSAADERSWGSKAVQYGSRDAAALGPEQSQYTDYGYEQAAGDYGASYYEWGTAESRPSGDYPSSSHAQPQDQKGYDKKQRSSRSGKKGSK